MSNQCSCGFQQIRILGDSGSYTCSELKSLESSTEIWPNSNWKTYNESLRLNPYVALHEVFRKNSSALFLPNAIPSNHRGKILQALEENSSDLPPGCLAFVTSGSTGVPKIVIHRKETLIAGAKKILSRYPKIQGMRFHNNFPGNYMAGLLNNGVLPWLIQSEVYLDSVFNFTSSFNIAERSQQMSTNFAWLSPGMISSLNAAIQSDLRRKPNWEFVLSATGPLSNKQANSFRAHGIELHNTYGSTELLFISGTSEIEEKISCGEPFDGVNLEIRSKSELLEMGVGEVWARSDTFPILELINDEKEDKYSILKAPSNEFRNTRDIGYLHQNHLNLVSRSDDIVVLGGVNFSLARLENFAEQYPGVVASCASARFGGTFSDLVLYYETVGGLHFDLNSFEQYIVNEFGVQESPRRFVHMKLPRTHHGKIDKSRIRNHN